MADFALQIITPDKLFFDGRTERLIVRTSEGEIGILARHENFVGALPSGAVKVLIDGNYRVAAISSGVVKVSPEKTTIIAEAIEWADEIDKDWAEKSAEDARQKLQDIKDAKEAQYAELKLQRALNRLKVSSGYSNEK